MFCPDGGAAEGAAPPGGIFIGGVPAVIMGETTAVNAPSVSASISEKIVIPANTTAARVKRTVAGEREDDRGMNGNILADA